LITNATTQWICSGKFVKTWSKSIFLSADHVTTQATTLATTYQTFPQITLTTTPATGLLSNFN
jgi:hypothetical protein